jgi:hypothetical protein
MQSITADKRPWPVWRGSTRTPVRFLPMTQREAVKAWHDLRRFERQTRQPGHQDGAIGRNGLAVVHACLFDLMDRATGQLEPTRAEIARVAGISIRSVDRGLAKLKEAGVLNWLRQCTGEIEDGIYRLRQKASAYFVLAQSHWRGFWRHPEPPAPFDEAWGRTPPLPDPIAMASMARAAGEGRGAQLAAFECDPFDKLATSLGGLLRGIGRRCTD